jgi:hypothetical protein
MLKLAQQHADAHIRQRQAHHNSSRRSRQSLVCDFNKHLHRAARQCRINSHTLFPLTPPLHCACAAPNPPRRVLVPMTPAKPSVTKGKFTLLSYNLLADLYATVREWLQNCWGRFGGGGDV